MDRALDWPEGEASNSGKLWCAAQFAVLLGALGLSSVLAVSPPTSEYRGNRTTALYYMASARALELDLSDLASELTPSQQRSDDHGIAIASLAWAEAAEVELLGATSELPSSKHFDLASAPDIGLPGEPSGLSRSEHRDGDNGINFPHVASAPASELELPEAAPNLSSLAPPAQDPGVKVGRSGFIMPFANGRITSLFNQGRRHPAIDLAGALGSTVVATTTRQRVVFAGHRGGYGNAVIARDDLGRTHLYGHLQSIVARVGAMLDQGQKLGLLGSTGHSTGPHVHYEVRTKAGLHLNPALLLFPERIVARGYSWGRGHPTAVALGSGTRAKSVTAVRTGRPNGRSAASSRQRHGGRARAASMPMPRSSALRRQRVEHVRAAPRRGLKT